MLVPQMTWRTHDCEPHHIILESALNMGDMTADRNDLSQETELSLNQGRKRQRETPDLFATTESLRFAMNQLFLLRVSSVASE